MNSATVHIRPAIKTDLESILAIYNDAILHTTAVYDYLPHTLAMRTAWFEQKQADGFPVLVAEQDGMICGFSSFGHFRAWAAYKYTVESSVYVSESHRRKGIGKLLLSPLIDKAKAMQLHSLIAGIDANNIPSIKLHEQFGFSQIGHFKEVGYKFGAWLDLLFFQLVLNTPDRPVV
jgi:L-amino acid N-acyltransferase